MWNKYFNVTSIESALELLNQYKERARLVAGATDLIIEFEKGIRKNVDALIDISRINNQIFYHAHVIFCTVPLIQVF